MVTHLCARLLLHLRDRLAAASDDAAGSDRRHEQLQMHCVARYAQQMHRESENNQNTKKHMLSPSERNLR